MSGRGPPADDPAETHDPAERFSDAWEVFILALRRSQARAAPPAEELTLSQYYLLRELETREAIGLRELAEAAGIAPATATRVLDGLERAALVRRTRSSRDRRAIHVSLTPEGTRRVAAKRRHIVERRRRLYASLDADERTQGERLLRHLADVLGSL